MENKIGFVKSFPTVGPNPEHQVTAAQIVVAIPLVPPAHTLDTNPPSPAPTMALQEETRSPLEGRSPVLMTPYRTGRTIPGVVFRFPHRSLTLQMDLGALHSILETIGLHLLQ